MKAPASRRGLRRVEGAELGFADDPPDMSFAGVDEIVAEVEDIDYLSDQTITAAAHLADRLQNFIANKL